MVRLGLVVVAVVGCGDNTPVVDAPLGSELFGSEPLEPAKLAASPTSVDFGTGAIAYEVLASVTVTNVGQTVSGPVMTSMIGSAAASFAVVSTTCTTLAPGATCTVMLKFAPSQVGGKTAALNLNASPGGFVMVPMEGTALSGVGAVSPSPSSHQFGTLVTGTSSASRRFTISWNGLGSTGALAVTPTGLNPTDFAIASQTCSGVVLAPGGSCTIDVVFTPTLVGGRSASFYVSGSPGGSASVWVTGIGG